MEERYHCRSTIITTNLVYDYAPPFATVWDPVLIAAQQLSHNLYTGVTTSKASTD